MITFLEQENRFFDLAMMKIAGQATEAELAELDGLLAEDASLQGEYDRLAAESRLLKEALPLAEATQATEGEFPEWARLNLQLEVKETFCPLEEDNPLKWLRIAKNLLADFEKMADFEKRPRTVGIGLPPKPDAKQTIRVDLPGKSEDPAPASAEYSPVLAEYDVNNPYEVSIPRMKTDAGMTDEKQKNRAMIQARGEVEKREFAVALAEAGNFKQAMEVAQQIEFAERKAEALSGIAVALAKAGELSQALEVAQELEDPERKERALSDVAVALAEAGNFKQAMEVAQKIKNAEKKADALRRIIDRLEDVNPTWQHHFGKAQPDQPVCHFCGYNCEPNAKFCGKCGKAIST